MHDVGAARLSLPPDVLLVNRHFLLVEAVRLADITPGIAIYLAWFQSHAPFRLLQQCLAGTKQGSTGGAGFRAAGHLTFVDSLHSGLVAHLTFLNLPEHFVVFELRYVVGAAHHTVTTPDTDIRVMRNDAGHRIVPHSGAGADRDTSRIDAVHTAALFETEPIHLLILYLRGAVLVDLDHVEGIAGEVARRIPAVFISLNHRRHAVDLFALGDTRLTTNA